KLNDNLLDQYIELVSNIYQRAPNSVEKFDTTLNLNNEFSSNVIDLDRNEITKYLEEVQLESGAFSLYGNKKTSDAMTTFLSVKLLSYFDADIPKKNELTVWLNDEINTIFGINDN